MYYFLALSLFAMVFGYADDEQPAPEAPIHTEEYASAPPPAVKHKKPPKGDPSNARAGKWIVKTGLPGDTNIHVTVKAKTKF
jgi:hypothetical protein